MERKLIEKADLVVVSASRLYETKRAHNANTFLITHGVDIDHFRKSMSGGNACAGRRSPAARTLVIRFLRPHRRLGGYRGDPPHGHRAAKMDVLDEHRRSEEGDVSELRELPNVNFLERRPYGTLPGYCKKFDIAVLPFVVNELTLAANPLKVCADVLWPPGLPVVATPLPEVLRLGKLVHVATTPEEFLRQCDTLVDARETGPDMTRSHSMDSESWDDKVEILSALVTQVPRHSERRARRLEPSQPQCNHAISVDFDDVCDTRESAGDCG